MKRWHYGTIILILVILSVVPGNADDQMGCEAADKSYNEGNYEEALLAYTVLWDLYKEPCARTGMTRAEKALQEQAKRLYRIGEALDKAGHEELATEAYISAVKKDPDYTDPIQALDQKAKVKLNVISKIIGKFGGFLEILFEELFKFMILILALLVFFLKCVPWIVNSFRSKPRLDIECFDKGSTGLELGKGLEMRVEDEFKKVINVSDKALMKLVEGPVNLKAPADIGSATHIKIISDLVEWAFPPNVVSLSGCLHKSKKNGAGLTLKLKSNKTGEIIAACTLWQKDYDIDWEDEGKGKDEKAQEKDGNPNNERREQDKVKKQEEDPSNYYCLAKPAAIWILFKLLEHERESQKEKIKKSVLGLGTENWESYVFFQDGRIRDLQGNAAEAKKYYLKALKIDPKNRYALCNLGLLRIEEGARETNDYKYEEAIGLLERAMRLSIEYEKNIEWLEWMKKVVKNKKCKHVRGDNMWFTAMLNLASAYHYGGNYEESVRVVSLLLHSITKTLKVLETVQEEKGKVLNRFWNCLTWSSYTVIMRVKLLFMDRICDIELSNNHVRSKNDYLDDMRIFKQYLEDLKDLIMVLRAISRVRAHKIEDTGKYMENISKKIIESKKRKGERTKVDQEESESDQEKLKQKKDELIRTEVKYDLACYYSIVGEEKGNERTDEYDKALKYLRDALLEGGIMLEWAKVDPDLQGLRKGREREFSKLIDTYTAKIPEIQKLSSEIESKRVEIQTKKINTEISHLQHSNPLVNVIVLLYNEKGIAVFKQGTGEWELAERVAQGNENLDLAVYRTLSGHVLNSHRAKIESSMLLSCGEFKKDGGRFNYVVIAKMNKIYGKKSEPNRNTEVCFVSKGDVKDKNMKSSYYEELLEKYFSGVDTLQKEVTCSCPGTIDGNRLKNAGEYYKKDAQFPMPLIKVEGVLLAFSNKGEVRKEFRGIMLVKKANRADKGAGKWILPATFVRGCETTSRALRREVSGKYEITLSQDNILSALKDRTDPGRDPEYFVWTQPLVCSFMGRPKIIWCETEDVRVFSLNELPWDDMSSDCQDILKECIPLIPDYVERVSHEHPGGKKEEARITCEESQDE
ncbi:MAG: NUDIX domain-containing protein [Candidatus Methanofastidiosia archaeon]